MRSGQQEVEEGVGGIGGAEGMRSERGWRWGMRERVLSRHVRGNVTVTQERAVVAKWKLKWPARHFLATRYDICE